MGRLSGDAVFLPQAGDIAPLVRMREPLLRRDPRDKSDSLDEPREGIMTGGPSPSVPLPSEPGLYTTVSHDISLELGSVEVVKSELPEPDLSRDILLPSSDEVDPPPPDPVLLLRFLLILWTRDAS